MKKGSIIQRFNDSTTQRARRTRSPVLAFVLLSALFATCSLAADKKIVLVAGRPSHGPGDHEHNAGCLLLKKCLDGVPGVKAEVHLNGWPQDPKAFDGVDAIVLYMDGGGGHPAVQEDRLQKLDALMKKGVGLACIHYAVEPTIAKGQKEFLDWIGGAFESNWSVNPHWTADFKELPSHPITRGVKPFKINDEWYFHMRFRDGMKGVTPILTAVAPESTMARRDGPHEGNPAAREAVKRGEPQHVAWACERADGGRGFGFTGAHVHNNWGDENFRGIVLNAILWIAKAEVPAEGVQSKITADDLKQNLDPKGKAKADASPAGSRREETLVANPQSTIRNPQHSFGPEAARASLKNFKVAQGLEVSLFASEPMVRNPTDMDIDERGRVWVTEGVNYRSTFKPWGILQPQGDRIVILEDTNGDGAADKETTFYQGSDINAALGICVLGRKVIVSSSPNVFVLEDTDGDDRADKKELLFTGISGVDDDHGVHAMVFGPDGKLYFNAGNNGGQLKDRNGKPVIDLAGNEVNNKGGPYRQGMAFRCNLDGTEVEVLGHNFRNPYEVAVDSFGTLWQSDNDDDGNKSVRINYLMEHGNFGYADELTGAGWKEKRTNWEDEIPRRHWHQDDPGVVPNLLITGAGSPTGICVYEGKLLPEIFRNQIIHADAGPRVVRAYPVQPDGAGYKAGVVELLSSNDSWFRPSDVCVGPDGSLFVADWHDAGVGGHHMADHDAAKITGRIYGIAPVGKKLSIPKLDLRTAAGRAEALQSPNLATRYLAWTKLHELQGKAEKELLALWKGSDERMRARALQLLARIQGGETKYVGAAIKDEQPDIRIAGLRIARELKLDVVPWVRMLVKDPSAQVRRECAIALRHNSSSEAPRLWAQLAQQHDGQDRWYLEALGIGADKQEDKFFAAWLELVGSHWNSAAGRDIVWRARSNKAPALLVKLIADKSTPEKARSRYIRAMDFIPQCPEKDVALVEMLTLAPAGN